MAATIIVAAPFVPPFFGREKGFGQYEFLQEVCHRKSEDQIRQYLLKDFHPI
jgi:hypothetical protein